MIPLLHWLEGTTTVPLETVMAARPSPMLRHERLGHLNECDMRLLGELVDGEQLMPVPFPRASARLLLARLTPVIPAPAS